MGSIDKETAQQQDFLSRLSKCEPSPKEQVVPLWVPLGSFPGHTCGLCPVRTANGDQALSSMIDFYSPSAMGVKG
jgi:hypothetical protein